jgi:UDP-N-acetylglucosamine:LPS N-acetylglucosamine transferase
MLGQKKYDCLLILSGPEPQRSILEQLLYNQLALKEYKVALVRGTNSDKVIESTKNVDVFEMLDSKSLLQLINDSDFVICRSGYSSIMDLVSLQKTAVLIPTPGQTEQEYLADYLYKKGLFYALSQREFCIDKAMKNKIEFPQKYLQTENELLKQKIMDLKLLLENKKDNKRNK